MNNITMDQLFSKDLKLFIEFNIKKQRKINHLREQPSISKVSGG